MIITTTIITSGTTITTIATTITTIRTATTTPIRTPITRSGRAR
jgi:hypothetical protein